MGRIGHKQGDGQVEPAPPKRKHDNTQHRELCLLAAKWLRSKPRFADARQSDPRPCPWVAVELVTSCPESADVFGWTYWTSVLIEVKVSRSDFLADTKKPFRQTPEDGLGTFRYYFCPAGLINHDEVPANWGLLWLRNGRIDVMKKPTPQVANTSATTTILTSIMRREGVKPRIFDYRK